MLHSLPINELLAFFAAYLIGSTPSSVLICRALKIKDPRRYGSQNPGATNVLRSGNKLAAALTLTSDVLKGYLAVYIALHFAMSEEMQYLAGVAGFLGHLFPLWLGFRGGKGVATGLGVMIALIPVIAFLLVLTWIAIAYFTRYSSLAAMGSAIATPAFYLFLPIPGGVGLIQLVCICMICLLILIRHRANFERILDGEESRLRFNTRRD